MQDASGIYAIVNITNDKRYIGSSIHLEKRRKTHWRQLRKNSHANRHLQNAWNRDGEAAFQFQVIQYLASCFLLDAEQKYVDRNNGGYNLAKYVDAAGRGRTWSPEQRAKMSAGHSSAEARLKASITTKEKWQDPAYKARLSAAIKKSHANPEVREKLRRVNKNRKRGPVSAETRARRSVSLKGHATSPETRAKISVAKTGKRLSKEHREKLSIGHLGKKQSPELVAKRTAILIQLWKSPEMRAKHSLGLKRMWIRRREQAVN